MPETNLQVQHISKGPVLYRSIQRGNGTLDAKHCKTFHFVSLSSLLTIYTFLTNIQQFNLFLDP